MSTVLLGVPDTAVYNVAAHIAALDATPVRFTADGAYRICYTLPDGTDVLMSPHAGAVPIVRWLTYDEVTVTRYGCSPPNERQQV